MRDHRTQQRLIHPPSHQGAEVEMIRQRQILSGSLRKKDLEPFANVAARCDAPTLVRPAARLEARVKFADIMKEHEHGKPLDIEIRQWTSGRSLQSVAYRRKPREAQNASGNVRAMMREMVSGANLRVILAPGLCDPAGSVLARWFSHMSAAQDVLRKPILRLSPIRSKQSCKLHRAPDDTRLFGCRLL